MEHCPFIGQTYEVAGLEIVHTHISLIESAGGTVKYSSSESILLGTFLSESDSTHSKSPETPSSTFVGRELAHQIEESKMGHQIVEAGDILWISAPIEQLMIVFMIEGVSVASSELRHISGSRSDRKLVEAVVAQWTSLQLSHSLFRRKYDACILAIYRAGTRYFLSDTEYLELNSGDVLLLETTSQGFHSLQKRKEFGLVTLYRTASVAKKGYGVLGGAICVVLFVAVIVVSSLEYVSVSQGFLGLALLYVFLRFLPFEMAMDSIDGDVLITMAASFATANALDETGAGQVMSDSLHEIIPFGQLGIYIVVYLMGFGMTQFISNPAAASMMYSAASNLAATSHSNKKGVLYVLMFACSASFLTPIGYSANSFLANRANVGLKEFLKVGIMLALIDMVVVVGMFTYLYRPPDESTDTN